MPKNSSRPTDHDSFVVDVKQDGSDVLIEFDTGPLPNRGGRLLVNADTARWLAYALLAVTEPSTEQNHLIAVIHENKVITSGHKEPNKPKAHNKPHSK